MRVEFDIAVPNVYAIRSATEPPGGLLDGIPYLGPRPLTIGRHTFQATAPLHDAKIVWAGASRWK
jgi:hypothetical protein